MAAAQAKPSTTTDNTPPTDSNPSTTPLPPLPTCSSPPPTTQSTHTLTKLPVPPSAISFTAPTATILSTDQLTTSIQTTPLKSSTSATPSIYATPSQYLPQHTISDDTDNSTLDQSFEQSQTTSGTPSTTYYATKGAFASTSGNKRYPRHSLPPSNDPKRHKQHDTQQQQDIQYTNLFLDIKNLPSPISRDKLALLLKKNPYGDLIWRCERSKAGDGYVLTFRNPQTAQNFMQAKFNNTLDQVIIRPTRKPNHRTDILLHNVSINTTNEEIQESLEQSLHIQIHSVYRLTRTSRTNPTHREPLQTVKLTINKRDEHLFQKTVTLFGFNAHLTSKPTPLPNILQCARCNQYGHTKQLCNHPFSICKKCGQTHNHLQCPNEQYKCSNCGEQHPATSKKCVTYKHFLAATRQNIRTQQRQQTYAQKAAQALEQRTTTTEHLQPEKPQTQNEPQRTFIIQPLPRAKTNVRPNITHDTNQLVSESPKLTSPPQPRHTREPTPTSPQTTKTERILHQLTRILHGENLHTIIINIARILFDITPNSHMDNILTPLLQSLLDKISNFFTATPSNNSNSQ